MIRKIALVAALICGSVLYGFGHSLYLKLYPLECVSCTRLVRDIFKLEPDAAIVLRESDARDSADVLERFNLFDYRDKIVWSDSLYQKLSAAPFSEVILLGKNGAVIERSDLAKTSLPALRSAIEKLRPFKLPTRFNVFSRGETLLIENLLTGKYSCWDTKQDSAYELTLTDSLIRSVYLDILRDPENYALCLKYRNIARPAISAAEVLNDSMSSYMFTLYKLGPILDDDTMLAKIHGIVTTERGLPRSVNLIDHENLPPDHDFYETTYFTRGASLFCYLPYMGADKKNYSNYTYLGLFSQGIQGRYRLEKLHSPVFTRALIDYSIFNNFGRYIRSHHYLSRVVTDHLVDLNTMERIRIPFHDSLLASNKKTMEDINLNFDIVDFKYAAEEHRFIILYRYGSQYYVCAFKKGAGLFEYNRSVLNNDSFTLRAICLADNGSGIIYFLADDDSRYFKRL